MGSGHFLEGIYAELHELHAQTGVAEADAHRAIVESQIYGGDIDTFATSLAAIRMFLLDEHPATLTVPEVSRALNAPPDSFATFDAVERAVVELVGAGLLHCKDGFVLPTRAALYSARLQLLG